ncbi:MAG: shikimate kinase [Lachnospiraceae bacterium]|nr:shikimate kinase [Lachnospiraceae bacterium]
MTILLFGVSNVGKTETGKLLAKSLNYDFYDLDDEVKKYLNITLEEFVSSGSLQERDQIRCKLIKKIIARKGNKVIAVTPLSYMQDIQRRLNDPTILTIELLDSPQHIFDRLVFSDENDTIYKNEDYKNKHKRHYISEIREDLKWYGFVYRDMKYHFDMNGKSPEEVVDGLIDKYQLRREEV